MRKGGSGPLQGRAGNPCVGLGGAICGPAAHQHVRICRPLAQVPSSSSHAPSPAHGTGMEMMINGRTWDVSGSKTPAKQALE